MNIINTVSELMQVIPKSMSLPIWGFREPEFHLLATNPQASKYYSQFQLMTGLASYVLARSKLLYLTLSAFAEYLSGIQFYGVQPLNFKGFTQLRDKRINSFTDTSHVIISPYEYILFNHPVRATADGVVESIDMGSYEDRVYRNTNFLSRLAHNPNDYRGNYISIKHNEVIRSNYCNLKKYSSKLKVGDQVKKGQIIGRVGLSSIINSPCLIYFLSVAPGIDLGFLGRYTFPLPSVEWERVITCRLTNQFIKSINGIEDFYAKDIKYTISNKLLYDVSLVKRNVGNENE